MALISKLFKFWHLDFQEKILLSRLSIAGLRLDYLLTFKGYNQTLDILRRSKPLNVAHLNRTASDLGQLVNAATFIVVKRDRACLRASVLLWWLLNANGSKACLCRGLRIDGEKLDGHAWVEAENRVVNDRKHISHKYHNITYEYWA